MSAIPPLSGDKQTFGEWAENDASDPEQTPAWRNSKPFTAVLAGQEHRRTIPSADIAARE
jgi:hypothetical protein